MPLKNAPLICALPLLASILLVSSPSVAQQSPESYCTGEADAPRCEVLAVQDHREDVGAVSVHFCKDGHYGSVWAESRENHLTIDGKPADEVLSLVATLAPLSSSAVKARVCASLPDHAVMAPARCFSRNGGRGCVD